MEEIAVAIKMVFSFSTLGNPLVLLGSERESERSSSVIEWTALRGGKNWSRAFVDGRT